MTYYLLRITHDLLNVTCYLLRLVILLLLLLLLLLTLTINYGLTTTY